MNDLKILVVDDDIHIRKLVEKIFSMEGASVACAQNGKEGLRLFYKHKPDLVILDVMMPEMDGYTACSQIRQLANTPIIMLTALGQDDEIIRGLDSGADDFITKPVSSPVLLAHARAVLRRERDNTISDRGSYSDNYLTVDHQLHKVTRRGEQIRLTSTEFRLLSYLIQNAGRVCEFRKILENVWGWEYQDSIEYVHVYISHIRNKIEQDPKNPVYIQTVHGVGYLFEKQDL